MIRLLERSDYDAVRALDEHVGLEPLSDEGFEEYSISPADWFVVAEDDGIAGYAHVGPDGAGTWHLFRIAVDPDKRRAGFGRSMIERIEAYLRTQKVESYHALVPKGDRNVRAFLDSIGFEKAGAATAAGTPMRKKL